MLSAFHLFLSSHCVSSPRTGNRWTCLSLSLSLPFSLRCTPLKMAVLVVSVVVSENYVCPFLVELKLLPFYLAKRIILFTCVRLCWLVRPYLSHSMLMYLCLPINCVRAYAPGLYYYTHVLHFLFLLCLYFSIFCYVHYIHLFTNCVYCCYFCCCCFLFIFGLAMVAWLLICIRRTHTIYTPKKRESILESTHIRIKYYVIFKWNAMYEHIKNEAQA